MTLTLGFDRREILPRAAYSRGWLRRWILAPALVALVVLCITARAAGAEPTTFGGRRWDTDDGRSAAVIALTASFALALAAMGIVALRRFRQLQREISRRQQAERALRENEARLERMVAASSEGFWDWNVAARTVWLSNRCQDLLGCGELDSTDSVLPWTRTISPADSARTVAALCRHLDARKAFDLECRVRRKDGDEQRVCIRGESIRNPRGAAMRVFGSVRNAADWSGHSELFSQERQSLKKQRLESIGQLAGGIAHEFNNLLHVILSYTEFALESIPEGCPARQDLQPVLLSSNRAAKLTRQMLDFSRSDEAKLELMEVNDVLADLFIMLRPLLGERIELEIRLGDDVGAIRVDAVLLQQAIMNLCINARDAMPNGGVLTISTVVAEVSSMDAHAHGELKPGRYAQFTVADNGCGMSPGVQEHIFEPFFTTKEVGKGTGLGLAMVYGIVNRHGGAVRVRSALGVGTTFTIYLPCGANERSANTNAAEPGLLANPHSGAFHEDPNTFDNRLHRQALRKEAAS